MNSMITRGVKSTKVEIGSSRPLNDLEPILGMIYGWRDGSVEKALAAQMLGPEFILQHILT